jgi:hypothetical protein
VLETPVPAAVRQPVSATALLGSEPLDEIKALLESTSLDRSATLKKLLVYLWQNRGEIVSEYAVATEALGRRPDFDPKIDATVRVQISRLRLKLKEFYEGEGADFPLLLQIPMGTHVLEVSQRPVDSAATAEVSSVSNPAPDRRSRHTLYLFLLAAMCVLVIGLGFLLWKNQQELSRPGIAKTPAREFWGRILDGPQRTRIVLPTPDFFFFKSDNTRVRDLHVNDYSTWDTSAILKKLSAESKEAPHLDQSYTVKADTFAAIGLARYLDEAGLGQRVDFVDNAQAPLQTLGQANQIVFGTYTTLYPYKSYLDRMNFVIGPHENYVSNLHPAPGEAKSYAKTWENGGDLRTVQPGIIALLPSLEGNTHLLLLQARYSSSLITFLTSSSGVDQLEEMWKKHGSPTYYEAVIFAEMDGDRVIRAWPVALHSFANNTK